LLHFSKLAADYPEEPQPHWEHSHCCCQHSPKEGADAERTEGDKDCQAETLPEDTRGGGEAEGAGDLSTDAVREPVFTAVSDEDMTPQSGVGGREREHEEGGSHVDLGVPEEDLAGVLKELELTLKVTSMLEHEKIEDLTQAAETETSCSSVRRRSRRRKAKKATH